MVLESKVPDEYEGTLLRETWNNMANKIFEIFIRLLNDLFDFDVVASLSMAETTTAQKIQDED